MKNRESPFFEPLPGFIHPLEPATCLPFIHQSSALGFWWTANITKLAQLPKIIAFRSHHLVLCTSGHAALDRVYLVSYNVPSMCGSLISQNCRCINAGVISEAVILQHTAVTVCYKVCTPWALTHGNIARKIEQPKSMTSSIAWSFWITDPRVSHACIPRVKINSGYDSHKSQM